MAREFSRAQRVADQIQRELAMLIQREVKDPRLGMVTVNEVRVSKDIAYADVYVTLLGTDAETPEVKTSVKILNGAAGFLRTRLGKSMTLRHVPALRFHFDASVSQGSYLSGLIDTAIASDRHRRGDQDNDEES